MDHLLDKEVEKYTKLRNIFKPQISSHHLSSAKIAFETLRMKSGDTILDAGAGMGYQTEWFKSHGLITYSTDIVPMFKDCIKIPIWDMHFIDKTDWVFCVDVLEHIPTEMIDKSISELKRIATKGMYLDICCREDNNGKLINEKLHLTVKPPEWWLDKLNIPNARHVYKNDQLIVCSSTYK